MAVSLTDQFVYRRLVTASGADEIWYEDINVSAGTMAELAAATGDIDTSDQLNVFEAYQKIFVVNGANLKVADFINTKLTHTALATAHARGDILTQDTTNKMVVDFTNTAKTATYGYVTAGTFECTNEVTGNGSGTAFTPTGINGMLTHAVLTTVHPAASELSQGTARMTVEYSDVSKTHTWGVVTAGIFNTDDEVTGDGAGSPTAFTPTATDISPPVWYDWTVYPGGASGVMPAKAYLDCLYIGKLILSGNPNYPHQWYMSKTANPFDWFYASTDPLTAAAGNNADAGEIGDVIRALIPYKDEYLIFGGASTIYVLTGPPGEGGVISEVDLTVGMFGANSWCFDGDGTLYFWGTSGIYKSTLGFRSIENLTEISLPDLLSDEDVNPETHRIVFAYDRKRHGLVITITILATGVNSNYFYDLKLKAFFPETYPEECGAYSMYYYAANDNDYADLLIGCKDGYIRVFDDSKKDDDIGNADETISSYAVWPLQHLAEDNDKKGKLTSLTIELAGGAANGTFADTDGVSYDIHVANDAETLIENIKGGVDPFTTGTLTGTGRKARIRVKVRGAWLGLRLYNSTASETWAVNKVYAEIKEVGRIK